MSQYFDKDFFKFLLGFMSIVVISLVIVAVLKDYQTRSRIKPTTPTYYVATPQP